MHHDYDIIFICPYNAGLEFPWDTPWVMYNTGQNSYEV